MILAASAALFTMKLWWPQTKIPCERRAVGGHSPPSCIWSGMHKLAFCEINELTGWLFNFFLLHSRTPYFGTAESPYIIFCAALKTQSETIPTALRILPVSSANSWGCPNNYTFHLYECIPIWEERFQDNADEELGILNYENLKWGNKIHQRTIKMS